MDKEERSVPYIVFEGTVARFERTPVRWRDKVAEKLNQQ